MKRIVALGICTFILLTAPTARAACPGFVPVSHVTAAAFPGATLSIVAADFNGNNIDLVATTDRNSVSMFAGSGNGTVASEVRYPAGPMPSFVATGDFKGDNKRDLVTVNTFGNSISIYLGNGDGTFGPPKNYIVGANPIAVAAELFNADSNIDLAVVSDVTQDVSILTWGQTFALFYPVPPAIVSF